MPPPSPPTGPSEPEEAAPRADPTGPWDPASLPVGLRRRALFGAVARIVTITTFLTVAYFVVPLGHDSRADISTIFVLVGGLVGLAAALVHQVRKIISSPTPQLRATEALATVVPLFIVVCSLTYVGLYQADPDSFSQPITKVTGLYFTVTVLATVGFGDITATTDTARLVVTVQMLLDLLMVGVLVKVIVGASRIGVERRRAERAQGADRARP